MLSNENGVAVSSRDWQEKQRAEAQKHAARVCPRSGVQEAVCGCDECVTADEGEA